MFYRFSSVFVGFQRPSGLPGGQTTGKYWSFWRGTGKNLRFFLITGKCIKVFDRGGGQVCIIMYTLVYTLTNIKILMMMMMMMMMMLIILPNNFDHTILHDNWNLHSPPPFLLSVFSSLIFLYFPYFNLLPKISSSNDIHLLAILQ